MSEVFLPEEYSGVHLEKLPPDATVKSEKSSKVILSEEQLKNLSELRDIVENPDIKIIQGIAVDSGDQWIQVGSREVLVSTDRKTFGDVLKSL